MRKSRIFFVIFLLGRGWSNCYAQVEPPNYNFSLDSLQIFYPPSQLAMVEEKHGAGELVQTLDEYKIYKFYISQIRYKFPVFVQVKNDNGQIQDFFARLPSYFLHDIFHRDLISKMGKQNKYHKKDNAAVYIWNDFEGEEIYYSASCTFTCFPMYLAAIAKREISDDDGEEYRPLLKRLNISQSE